MTVGKPSGNNRTERTSDLGICSRVHAKFQSENRKGKYCLEDLCIDRRILKLGVIGIRSFGTRIQHFGSG
jgi:hypothetical protein